MVWDGSVSPGRCLAASSSLRVHRLLEGLLRVFSLASRDQPSHRARRRVRRRISERARVRARGSTMGRTRWRMEDQLVA